MHASVLRHDGVRLDTRTVRRSARSRKQQAVVCQARSKAAASATVTAAPATEHIVSPAHSKELPPSEDPDQRNRRDASTSYGGANRNGSSSTGRSGDAAAPSGPRQTVRLAKGQRPGARQLPDSLRAGIGMAGVPVDGANRTVRMRRVPRYQQQQQQQQQQRAPPMEESGGVSVVDWDALDWETDVQLREEESQRAQESKRGPMPEEHREKIRAALKGKSKGQLTDTHRSRIAASMKRLMTQGGLPAKISAATTGKLKTCAICGGEGHNKATCPTIPASVTRERQQRRCSVCGKLGHRRDSCPEVQALAAAEYDGVPTRTCSQCGGKGHDRRTCPELDAKAAVRRRQRQSYVARKVPDSAAEIQRCGYCGGSGHNRRTCPTLQADRSRLEEQLSSMDEPPEDIPPELLPASPDTASAAAAGKMAAETLPPAASAAGDATAAALGQGGTGNDVYSTTAPAQDSSSEGAQSEAASAARSPPSPAAKANVAKPVSEPMHAEAQPALAQSAAAPTRSVPVTPAHRSPVEAGASRAVSKAQPTAQQVVVPKAPVTHSQPAAAQRATAPQQQAALQEDPSSPVQQAPAQQASAQTHPAVATRAPQTDARPLAALKPGEPKPVFPVPLTVEEEVEQVVDAVLRAWRAGVRRQMLQLMLPLSQEMTADGDAAWPGGIRQQFLAARPMVEALLRRLKQEPSLEGSLTGRWVDESDCVGAWESPAMAAVLFPSADALSALRHIDADAGGQRLILCINPQWRPDGQVISDFGLGRTRREAEEFIRWFEDVYYLKRLVLAGDDVRVLHAFAGDWQVHTMPAGGKPRLLAKHPQQPTLTDLQYLVQGLEPKKAPPPDILRRLFGYTDPEPAAPPSPATSNSSSTTRQDAALPLHRRGGAQFAEPVPGDFAYSGEQPRLAGRSTKAPTPRRVAAVNRGAVRGNVSGTVAADGVRPSSHTVSAVGQQEGRASAQRGEYDIITGRYAEPQPGDFGAEVPQPEPHARLAGKTSIRSANSARQRRNSQSPKAPTASPVGSVDGDGTGRFGEVDPALRSRDLRTEPVKQFAKWASFLASSDSD